MIDLPSLEGSNLGGTCKEVPEMPSFKASPIAIWSNGDNSVLCCGGYDNSYTYKRCLKYTGDEWIDLGDMLRYKRDDASAAGLSDGRYWISGGKLYEQPSFCIYEMYRVGEKLSLLRITIHVGTPMTSFK